MTTSSNIDVTPAQYKEVISLLDRYLPNTTVWAYGSRANWSARPDSDLDIVAFARTEQQTQVSLLREAFEESSLPFSVDFFVWESVPKQFRKNIEADHIALIETTEEPMEGDVIPYQNLKSLCIKIGSGSTPRGGKSVYLDTGEYSLIRSQNVLNNSFSKGGLAFIDNDAARKLENVAVEEADVLLNITGDSVARCCQVDNSVLPARVNQHVSIIRPVSGKLDPKYLCYFLVSPSMQNHMLSLAGIGATRNALTKGMIENFEIPLPPIETQTSIAHILGSLDDKIELNRQMNTTLEAMAQALFKSWFVDFDPVIDNVLATGNPIPDALQAKCAARQASGDQRKPLPEAIRQQFPSSFDFSEEMGWVPKGWSVSKFQDIAEVVMGQSPKGDTYNTEDEGLPLINGPVEFGLYFTQKSKWTTAPTKLAKAGDLIVCVRGSTTGRYVKSDDEYCLGRGVCAIRGKKSQAFVDYTYKSHKEALLRMTTGSTFPNWSGPTLKGFSVINPTGKITLEFDCHAGELIRKTSRNIEQIQVLTDLRDTLLPKLLSGKLRIPDAEKLVATAL